MRTTIFVALFFSSQTFAQDRIELLGLAHEGMHYFLVSALSSPGFTKNLKSDQIIFFQELFLMLEQDSALRFYESQKIAGFQTSARFKTFAYVDFNESVQSMKVPDGKAPELKNVFDREPFKNLKPGEPERYLKSTADFSGAILVNNAKLNEDPNLKFDLGRALSILVHEYGHKVRHRLQEKNGFIYKDADIQPLIDRAAEDLGQFVRGKIMEFPLKNGVTIFALNALGFPHEAWLNNGFIAGRAPISLLHQQGLYVWTEFQGAIRNISKPLRSSVSQNLLPNDLLNDAYYQFVDVNMILPARINVVESDPGKVRFDISVGQIAVQIPFMKPGVSPDPKQAKFNERYRWSFAGHMISPINKTISAQVNGNALVMTPPEMSHRQVQLLPDFTARLGRVEWRGKDLFFYIEVPDESGRLTFFALTKGLFLQASEVKIKTSSGKSFYLTSTHLDPSKATTERVVQYVFKLENAALMGIKDFDVENIYLREPSQLLAEHSEVRLEIPLFEKMKVVIPEHTQHRARTLIKNPLRILDVQTQTDEIKVKVRSAQPIQTLALVFRVQDLTYALDTITGADETAYYKPTENTKTERQVQIELVTGQFRVFQNADGTTELSVRISDVMDLHKAQLVDAFENKNGLKMTKHLVRVVDPRTELIEVAVVNTALEADQKKTEQAHKMAPLTRPKNSLDAVMVDFASRPREFRIIKSNCTSLFQ